MKFPSIHTGSAAVCLILALTVTTASLEAATVNLSADYDSMPLIRGKQNQVLLRQKINNRTAYITLDTGSPVTCVDESKSKLFSLVPTSTDGSPPLSLMVNGMRHRIAVIPSLQFGTVLAEDIPVVLIDLTDLNRVLRAKHDRPNDAILGLDAMHELHAVIDCGSDRLLLRNGVDDSIRLGAILKRGGWREIPMRLSQGHCIVSGLVNHIPVNFIVDTGSPVSVLDEKFCQKHRITLSDSSFALKAIHFETDGAKVGRVQDLIIGKRMDLGPSLVAVFDVEGLLKGNSDDADAPGGLLGSRTLSRASAFIDCENMKLYLKAPEAVKTMGF
jgi:hypothetical protein